MIVPLWKYIKIIKKNVLNLFVRGENWLKSRWRFQIWPFTFWSDLEVRSSKNLFSRDEVFTINLLFKKIKTLINLHYNFSFIMCLYFKKIMCIKTIIMWSAVQDKSKVTRCSNLKFDKRTPLKRRVWTV